MTEAKRDMKIEVWPVDRVMPSMQNTKYHPPAQVQALADAMREVGWTAPLVVAADGELLAGHGRFLAAAHLGLTEVPVIVRDHLTKTERRAFRIADNRLAERSAWDSDALASEVGDLFDAEFDMTLLGFSDLQLSKMIGETNRDTGEDDPPDLEEVAVSAEGDVWVMGPHRLVCGDATDGAVAAAAIAGMSPVMMVTDPPDLIACETEDVAAVWEHFSGTVAYVWHDPRWNPHVTRGLEHCGFRVDGQLVWRKTKVSLGRGNYQPAHMCCAYGVVPRRKSRWNGDLAQGTVWRVPPVGGSDAKSHPERRPVELFRRPMRHSSQKGDAVFDPFIGSGTALVAAHMTGRVCAGIEMEPLYTDLAVRRWQALADADAVHEATGETFAERSRPVRKKPRRTRKGSRDGEASP